MFREILSLQWKWSRAMVLVGALVGFALPILSVRIWTADALDDRASYFLLSSMNAWGYGYPVLSGLLALVVAMIAWGADHRGKHVYALSLPLPRWYYVLLKLGAGMVVLIPPIVAVLVGGILAAGFATIPAGLFAYPVALTVRFTLTTVVAFSCFFAISAGTNRTAGVILGVIGVLVAAELIAVGLGSDESIIKYTVERLFFWPGPLDIFGGRWMLIDV